jgi:hypothetical protein
MTSAGTLDAPSQGQAPTTAAAAQPSSQVGARLSRRRFLRRALALGAVPVSLGAYATQV